MVNLPLKTIQSQTMPADDKKPVNTLLSFSQKNNMLYGSQVLLSTTLLPFHIVYLKRKCPRLQ